MVNIHQDVCRKEFKLARPAGANEGKRLVDLLSVFGNIVKYSAHKGKNDADKYRPFRYHIAAVIQAHRFAINRVRHGFVIDNQIDGEYYPNHE